MSKKELNTLFLLQLPDVSADTELSEEKPPIITERGNTTIVRKTLQQ